MRLLSVDAAEELARRLEKAMPYPKLGEPSLVYFGEDTGEVYVQVVAVLLDEGILDDLLRFADAEHLHIDISAAHEDDWIHGEGCLQIELYPWEEEKESA